MKIFKTYDKPFAADESKLTRLMAVIDQKLAERQNVFVKSFEAHLSNGKIYETDALVDVFRLDNSKRIRVKRLVISCYSSDKEHAIHVDFDDKYVDVSLVIRSSDSKWAAEVMSLAEEQVERTLQSTIWARIHGGRSGALALSATTLFVGAITVAALNRVGSYGLSRTMWLSPSDLVALDKTLKTAKQLTPDQVADVVTRQVGNLVRGEYRGFFPPQLADWRLLLIVLPVVVAIAAFVYLIARCYPAAVFAWGDTGQSYQDLVNRRKTIWSVLLGSLFVGILANLFVFGLSNFLRP